MRRALALCLILALCLSAALCEQEAHWQALTLTSFHLRREPDESAYRIIKLPKHGKVRVLEWGDEWCLITYGIRTGYAKTEWLYCFQSLDPAEYPLRNMPWTVSGYVVFEREADIRTLDFEGITAKPGQIACADTVTSPGTCVLPVWRDTWSLAEGEGSVHAFVPWEEARPGDIIGGFTTYCGASQGGNKAADRMHNIVLGCEKLDGTVIAPGGRFSFNQVCGPYLKSRGYRIAPNYSSDHEGYGGGVCQVTTTLYNAVLTLPLLIEDWAVHRVKGVPYVPQYFDAAVGTYSDLVFVNTLPYDIRITAQPQDGIVTVLILRN